MAGAYDEEPSDEYVADSSFEEPEPSRWGRFRARGRSWGRSAAEWFNKAEHSYLAFLRQTSLVAATLLIFGAALLFIAGVALQFGNPAGIQPEQVSVSTGDVISAPAPAPAKPAAEAADTPPRWSRVLPADFRERYFRTFQSNFAPYYRQGDKRPDRKTFFETMFPDPILDYVEGFDDARLAGSADAQEQDLRPLLANLQAIVAAAAADSGTKRELQGYRSAKKVQVCETVRRERVRYESYWNSLSTSCPYWYETPYGCSDTRAIREPYTERVCRMEFPDEVANPQNVMLRLQERYFGALDRKLQSAEAEADERRAQLMERKANGRAAISTSVKIFLGFLALMFVYILIALERHHRVISRTLASRS